MTPSEVELAARRKYNSIGDTLWSSAEIMDLIYEKSLEIAVECLLIERTYTSSSVADQSEYDWPSNAIVIKRVEYDGSKLFKIDDRDADSLNLLNSAVVPIGTPQHYWTWNETFKLLPAPGDAGVDIKVYAYVEPQPVTVTSTLEIPTQFHMDLVNGVVEEMCLKDENASLAKVYADKWEAGKKKAKAWQAKQKRGDAFASVKNEEAMPVSWIGAR